MSAVIPFPADRCHRPARAGTVTAATVIIFPGVCVERVGPVEEGHPPLCAKTVAAQPQLREDYGEV